jgi:hypothetical protein
MNKLAIEIPNRIKQPAMCCVHCGKSYIKRVNLNKHVVICELLQRSKHTKPVEEDEPNIPSQHRLFQMLIELGEKYSKLEEKVEEMSKWVSKKKKKVNVLEWLNANIVPSLTFGDIIDKIIVDERDAEMIIENNFSTIFNEIFSRSIYTFTESENPIFAFVQKPNVFYIYDSDKIWTEITRGQLTKFLNRVHMKIIRAFYDWRQKKTNEIKTNDSFSIMCDKTLAKIMGIDFTQENILSKIKGAMYARMKTDMKALIEYEFEF